MLHDIVFDHHLAASRTREVVVPASFEKKERDRNLKLWELSNYKFVITSFDKYILIDMMNNNSKSFELEDRKNLRSFFLRDFIV